MSSKGKINRRWLGWNTDQSHHRKSSARVESILLSVAIREIRGFVFASGLTGYYAPKSVVFNRKFSFIKRRVFHVPD
jgi:hypothetical protein